MKERKTWLLPSVMTVLMVSQIVLVFFLYNQAGVEALRYVGWAILAASAVFGWLPIFILRRKGGVPKGKSYVRTTVLVTSGIYAVVRHPQSGLAGILLSLGLILIAQNWVIAIIGVAAMVVVYLGTRQEDRYCVEKFGDDYKRYMQSVPAVDLFTGVIRLLRRRRRE